MSDRRVGIITYHNHINYGTMLQALALQEAVSRLGDEAEIIDFYQINTLSESQLKKIHKQRIFYYIANYREYSAKLVDKMILHIKKANINSKKKLFSDFYKKYITISSNHYSTTEEINANPPVYDIYMVGSDQTWNPNVGGNPEAFYLTFAPKSSRRVSYAPSVSVTSLSDEQANRMRQLLNNIDILSCREKDGSELLHTITGRNVTTVLDPTFLLNHKEWNVFASTVKVPEKYILQYLIGKKPEHRAYIKRLSRKLQIPIITIPCVPKDMLFSKYQYWCGPGEFLSLIKNAYLVCTDSFHGTAFSINYRRNVLSFFKTNSKDKKSENSRIENLYRAFGIEGRMVIDFEKLIDEKDIQINYSLYEDRILSLVHDSKMYLNAILREQ